MNILEHSIKTILLLTTAFVLISCAGTSEKIVKSSIKDIRQGPKDTPVKNITNFSDALRCMDEEFLRYRIRDVKFLMEDLEDRTGEVKVGTRDMLITAISDMTRRSRGITLMAYGTDSGNLISFLRAAGNKSHYADVPKYDIRGSISQLDKDVVKTEKDLGVALPKGGGGIADSAGGSILGLDLSVIDTRTTALIPGLTSRNSVVITTSNTKMDLDRAIKKNRISFGFVFAKSEGKGQALRNLIELSSVELMGRVFKIGYWNCLGIDPEVAEVKQEIKTWFDAMKIHSELIPYLEAQLRNRGFYKHANTGVKSPELIEAMNSYRDALGMSRSTEIDLMFFSALLNQQTPKNPSVHAAREEGEIVITSVEKLGPFEPAEQINLTISTKMDSYLYCFYRDDENKIIRFFPNRFQRSAFVSSKTSIQIPGDMPFEIKASEKGISEAVGCFSVSQKIIEQLPIVGKSKDFEEIQVLSLDEVKKSFQSLVGNELAEAYYFIDTK